MNRAGAGARDESGAGSLDRDCRDRSVQSGREGDELSLEEFLEKLPKAELHLHLEGSITPGRFLALAHKYSTEFHTWDEEAVRRRLLNYRDFQAFLKTFKIVCEHLREPADYADLLDDLADYFPANNIRYAELFVTPSIPWRFERDGEAVLLQLLQAGARLQQKTGVKLRWILDCVRQFGFEPAQRTAELAQRHRAEGVVAVGLGGDENSVPASDFGEVFAWVRAHALHVHIHAGETGVPQQIWDALEILGANRIGHGIQAARDPRLMSYLKEHAVGLDVCLTSNQATGAWRPLQENPFWLLRRRGVPVTLNTDDPGLFQTDLNREYRLAAENFKLTREDLSYIAIQSVRSSFLPHEEKMELMQQFQNEIAALA